jgi:hypothetical protein
MNQMPRWYRRQELEHKLKGVLSNPYSDISHVQAARKAVDETLAKQDRDYENRQMKLTNRYKDLLK